MRYIKYFFLALSILLCIGGGRVYAQQDDRTSPLEEFEQSREYIESYDTTIRVDRDAKLTVTERIVYNFGNAIGKHGIFRTIPVTYQGSWGSAYSIHPRLVSVTDDQGISYQTKVSHSGNEWEVKVGDADITVTGMKVYIITYTIEGAASFSPEGNPDHDEIYWNAVGTKWEVPIKKATARVELPQTVPSDLQVACYMGRQGSKTPCKYTIEDQQNISFIATRELSYNEGLTAVVSVPKGVLQEPSDTQHIIWFMRDNWPIGVPLVALVVMLILWSRYGRDPKGRGTVIAEFEAPKDMSPIEVGTMIDQRVDGRDISSLIIDLAVRGYIKIKEISTGKWTGSDYELIKVREGTDLKRDYEHIFFHALFTNRNSVTLSSLKTKFHTTAEEIKKEVYATLVSKKYFASNPETVRSWCIISGVVIGFGGVMLLSFLGGVVAAWSVIGPIIAGAIVAGFGFIMPKMTKEGAIIKEHIQGFKLFLMVTEKDRLKFHNAPEKKPELFEKYLPYAMVLKVEGEWAKQFEGIYKQPPDWYSGNWQTFNVVMFATHLNSFSSFAQSSLTTAPSKSSGFSGGSSGGGFGGGGGGSW